jgi:hypothetical protein
VVAQEIVLLEKAEGRTAGRVDLIPSPYPPPQRTHAPQSEARSAAKVVDHKPISQGGSASRGASPKREKGAKGPPDWPRMLAGLRV